MNTSIQTVPFTDIEAKQLVQNQRHFFNQNNTKSVDFRLEQLRKLKTLLLEHEDAMHDAIFKDFGKSKYENQLTEFFPLIDEINVAIKNLKKWIKPKNVATNILNFPAKSYLVPEPLGVSLVIGAWNFPYNLTLTPLVGSMAAGNTTILKPSELAQHTSAIMTKILNENFDSNYIHVIEGGIPETTALLNQRYDKIFFTGSPMVGKIVNKAAAEHLTNVTLELGGKNPAIFTKDAALKMSVKRMIWAKFVNSGQFCITTDYALVHKDIKDDFLKYAVEEIKKNNFSRDNHNYVQIINERNFDRVVNLIDPDKVFYGGNYNKNERYIEPTILHNVNLDDAVMQEEIFGPVLPIITYESLDEAFDIIKHFEKPLAAYLFSDSSAIKDRFLNEISFGSGAINDCVMQISNPNLPFGGVGHSGMGRYHGKYSFECFSHFKAILDKPTAIETNLKYYGYNEKKLKLVKLLS
ncbi:aldehyde dehydrogenase [Winogradskyella sp.]|jgi:aldehyde dehydrogenase (NAD+)|uniref:aldehyde dehydrogenase n=1 Tax=Winogradskyella sp. TaxID=1883156 RepID=UPI0025EF17A1|nr:aldehyde dehydrogenase [Winogradskyella sp.]MCT4629026.1 aldehyde dehydrogenase [Winogradskyella sp.]